MTEPKPPKNGVAFKTGKAKSVLASKAAKVLKNTPQLSASAKKLLQREVNREPDAVGAYHAIYNGEIIAKTDVFKNTAKSINGYETLFGVCKKIDVAALSSEIRALAKAHETSLTAKQLSPIRDGRKYSFHISLWIRGKTKPKYEASLVLWQKGKLYDMSLEKTETVADLLKNLKYVIKTLAKAA